MLRQKVSSFSTIIPIVLHLDIFIQFLSGNNGEDQGARSPSALCYGLPDDLHSGSYQVLVEVKCHSQIIFGIVFCLTSSTQFSGLLGEVVVVVVVRAGDNVNEAMHGPQRSPYMGRGVRFRFVCDESPQSPKVIISKVVS